MLYNLIVRLRDWYSTQTLDGFCDDAPVHPLARLLDRPSVDVWLGRLECRLSHPIPDIRDECPF